jgi:biotin carboxyl carrier protein
MYTTKNNQFVNLVKGEYGKTPVAIDPEFRLQICGVREETAYDISKYQRQPNPELPEAGGVKLAENEKEVLLLELFPLVAKPYLTNLKKKAYEAQAAAAAPKAEDTAVVAEVKQPITGKTVLAPLPGKVIDIKVKVGDTVAPGQEVAVLEAMKMENSITADFGGVVKQILVAVGDNVATDAIILEIGDAAPAAAPAPKAAVTGNKVVAPLPGRVIALKVKEGDTVAAGDEVALLEAMKMENSITSDYSGTVQQILVAEGENIATDAVIMIIG